MSAVGWSVAIQPTGQVLLQFSSAERGLEYQMLVDRPDYVLFARTVLAPLLTQPDMAVALLGLTEEVHADG